MHALIVASHPVTQSLTHSVASRIARGITQANADHTVEIADLASEAFDPRFTATDIAVHLRESSPSPDVVAEQARIDRADALVLVYPVYWWSLPAQLKGWIDRVFVNGWAYDETPSAGLVKKLGRLAVHLVALGLADPRTYARRGYFGAMRTQIEQGIFDYCGARVASSELLLGGDASSYLEAADAIGRKVFGLRASATS